MDVAGTARSIIERGRVWFSRFTGRIRWRARAAAALHELQRGLPELQQLLAGHGRERLHRGYERSELLHDGVVRGRHAIVTKQLLELRRRCRAKGPQHQPPRRAAQGGGQRAAGRHAGNALGFFNLRDVDRAELARPGEGLLGEAQGVAVRTYQGTEGLVGDGRLVLRHCAVPSLST